MYQLLFSSVLRRIPAEAAHKGAFGLIRAAGRTPAADLQRRWFATADPILRLRVFGHELPGPLGLAAGFDKDAHGIDALATLGFGHVEIGTVTARPQPGNPKPRLFRLPTDRAVINRMGFNNAGAGAVAARLGRREPRADGPMLGVNIGKSKVVPESEAIADYVTSTRFLAPYADYFVVNVSSPNTPGLRDLQAVERLRPLLRAVRDTLDRHSSGVPLLVKIAPDLADSDVDAVADLALELSLDGVIATNTTIRRDGLLTDPARVAAAGTGGLSGAPLKQRSLAVLRRLRSRVDDRLVLVSVGGIETAADAWERIRAGASLLQAYTAFIYGGPTWPRRINRGLANLVRDAGFSSLDEAIGSGD